MNYHLYSHYSERRPQYERRLAQQEQQKELVVVLPDARVQPRTVVIKLAHASPAVLTVLRSHWLLQQYNEPITLGPASNQFGLNECLLTSSIFSLVVSRNQCITVQ